MEVPATANNFGGFPPFLRASLVHKNYPLAVLSESSSRLSSRVFQPGDGASTSIEQDKSQTESVASLINSQETTDDSKIARRRYLNKLAAQRCRDKKKIQADQLKTETEKLECQNTALKHTVRKLVKQKDELVFLLKTHAQTFHPGEDILRSVSDTMAKNTRNHYRNGEDWPH